MTIYAVIDTNVLVSAMLSRHPDAATVLVVDLLLSGKITPLFNDEIIGEYTEVLHREKFRLPGALVDVVIDGLKARGISMQRVASNEKFSDPKDIVFYEIALSKEGAFLVTGNTKHFPVSPIVVTPSQMLEIISNSTR